jgi:hypothetical protein
MDSGILMIQDSILVCSSDPRIPHTAATRFKIWKEAMKTATLLDGLLIIEILDGQAKTRFEQAFGTNPKFANHLWTWGEAGAVKTKHVDEW